MSPMPRAGTLMIRSKLTLSVSRAQDAQVRQRVLDLAPGVEPRPADELVADAVAQERFLDRAGLGVHPVHDRDVAGPEVESSSSSSARRVRAVPRPPTRLSTWRAIHSASSSSLYASKRWIFIPPALLGPELLVLARRVARDDGVGGVEDQLGRAVVAARA